MGSGYPILMSKSGFKYFERRASDLLLPCRSFISILSCNDVIYKIPKSVIYLQNSTLTDKKLIKLLKKISI